MKPKILVPFDFSATAERALAWAADLQKTANSPPILIVHAINSRPPGALGIEIQALLPDEEAVAALERRMLDAARGHDVLVLAARVVVRSSPVEDIILDEASGGAVDLIVMGTHGRAGVKRLLLGSVAEHVLRKATCPVVTVHGPREE